MDDCSTSDAVLEGREDDMRLRAAETSSFQDCEKENASIYPSYINVDRTEIRADVM